MKSTVARLRKNCPICAQNGGYWSHLTEKSIRDYVGSEGGVGAPSVSSDAMYKKYICEENVCSKCASKTYSNKMESPTTVAKDTMQLSVLSQHNNDVKMQDLERFEHQVEDMYNILLNISSELLTIKSLMKANRSKLNENDNKTEVNSTGNGAAVPSRLPLDGDISNNSNRNKDRILSPPSINRMSLGSSHVVASTTITNLDSASQKFKLEDVESPVANAGGRSSSALNSPYPAVSNRDICGPEAITLNVGGKRHEVRWDTLDKFPNSRLGRLRHSVSHRGIQELCDSYNLSNREYFFDRSPRNFDAILGLYRTGKLHLSQGVCVQDFCEELEYWGLCDLHLEPCCQHTYYRARWLLPESLNDDECMDGYFTNSFCGNLQHKLWNLLENPNSSFAAKIVAVLSCLFVVASTFSLIISTLPMFQNKNLAEELRGGDDDGTHYAFSVAEAIFVGWFTFEYIVRFIAAPQKFRFIKAGMNIIDLLGVLPYFLSLGLSLVNQSNSLGFFVPGEDDTPVDDSETYHDEMKRIAQIFRIMRILRIFKLARHITGLQTLGFTLKNSYKELGLLMLVVIMGMLIFSGLAYVSEKNEENTAFISMPQALYWAIITMTSVGYGDIYPTTWFGKLVGSACAICGVLCISLPIPIIVNNFNKFYEKAKIEEEIEAKRKKTSWEDAKRDLMEARRKSCIVAAGDWKRLFKGSAMTSGPAHRPSVPTISEVGSVGQNSQSGVLTNNLAGSLNYVPPLPPPSDSTTTKF